MYYRADFRQRKKICVIAGSPSNSLRYAEDERKRKVVITHGF
jgi:hypothetical protein